MQYKNYQTALELCDVIRHQVVPDGVGDIPGFPTLTLGSHIGQLFTAQLHAGFESFFHEKTLSFRLPGGQLRQMYDGKAAKGCLFFAVLASTIWGQIQSTKKVKPKIKTPISYYGGKQNMLKHILPLIPEHHTYIEPFFGGGAVFWGKEPSQAEVVNDINSKLITFYKELKYNFEELREKVDETFHSRQQHAETKTHYIDTEPDDITDQLRMAWSVWVQTNLGFAGQIGSSFGYDRQGKCPLRLYNKKERFTDAYKLRMQKVTIECYDVLKVMKAYDDPDAFFYLDPPYVTSNQGHYKGYSMDHFRELLDACAQLKGKFLLSSYPETLLMEYRQQHGWKSQDVEQTLAVDGRRKENRTKLECLTWNY